MTYRHTADEWEKARLQTEARLWAVDTMIAELKRERMFLKAALEGWDNGKTA